MRSSVRTLLAVLLVGAVAAGCGGSAGTGDKGYVDGQGIVTRLPVAERKPPGPVEGETLEGKDLSLTDYAGKVVVLNVWGSWCPPCRKEKWRLALHKILFKDGDIVELAEQAEGAVEDSA